MKVVGLDFTEGHKGPRSDMCRWDKRKTAYRQELGLPSYQKKKQKKVSV